LLQLVKIQGGAGTDARILGLAFMDEKRERGFKVKI
jgi:hypothetical protein